MMNDAGPARATGRRPGRSAGDGFVVRIGIFYDGNYFSHVSNFYRYNHAIGQRIRIGGMDDFVRSEIGTALGVDRSECVIVETKFFRSRFDAREAEDRNRLLADRVFDDTLAREGIMTHYLPTAMNADQGIELVMALEVIESVVQRRLAVAVLVTGDAKYVPLVRKIHGAGTQAWVLGWTLDAGGEHGTRTRTAHGLVREASRSIDMSALIEQWIREDAQKVESIFHQPKGDGNEA